MKLKVPFKIGGLTGSYGSGKTLAMLDFLKIASEMGSPEERLLFVDSEGSAVPYLSHPQYSSLKMSYIDSRLEGTTLRKLLTISGDIKGDETSEDVGKTFDVICIDPFDQFQEELTDNIWEDPKISDAVKEKSSALVWGKVKRKMRKTLISVVASKCEVLLLSSHVRREFVGNAPSGRFESKFMEPAWRLCDFVAYLQRRPNTQLPDAVFSPPYGKSRLLGLPPKIMEFTWQKFFKACLETPVDWAKLKKEEMVEEAYNLLSRLEKLQGDKEDE